MHSTKVLLVIFVACAWTTSVSAQADFSLLPNSRPSDSTVAPGLVKFPENGFASSDPDQIRRNFAVSPNEVARAQVRDALNTYDQSRQKQLDEIMQRINVDTGTGPFHQKPLGDMKPTTAFAPLDFLAGPGMDPETVRRLYNLQAQRNLDSFVDRLPRYVARIEGKLGSLPVRLDYGDGRRCHLKGAGLCLRVQLP
jgi:hypothetical protein